MSIVGLESVDVSARLAVLSADLPVTLGNVVLVAQGTHDWILFVRGHGARTTTRPSMMMS